MTLPTQTSLEDAQKVCAFLRTKATGSSETDAKAVVGPQYLDTRKLAAYEAWGLIERDGSSIKATSLGRELGAATTPDAVREPAGRACVQINAYRLALDYLRNQGLTEINATDLGAWWHEHVSGELGTSAEKSIASAANAFFSLAASSGVGRYVHGNKYGAARLVEVDIQRIAELLDATIPSGDDTRPDPPAQSTERENGPVPLGDAEQEEPPVERRVPAVQRVFIAHGKNLELVEQVKSALDVAGLRHEVADEDESPAIPVPEKVLQAMRRCTAAIICVTPEAARADSVTINQNVLIEIGAAFVLYDRRVVLVWDRALPVPSNLQGLYRCEVDGSALSWEEGLKLLRALRHFSDEESSDGR